MAQLLKLECKGRGQQAQIQMLRSKGSGQMAQRRCGSGQHPHPQATPLSVWFTANAPPPPQGQVRNGIMRLIKRTECRAR
eukprot:262960-Chlamydomonas_euryale.AAC.1